MIIFVIDVHHLQHSNAQPEEEDIALSSFLPLTIQRRRRKRELTRFKRSYQ